MHRLARLSTLVVPLVALASTAHAGGYDTPILYSAQHMAMGGAAIGYVDDPSAMFHNPAGLMGTKGLTLMANLTLVTGAIKSAPYANDQNEESEPLLALAPLVGVSYDVNDVIAFGLAFYPVASAGARTTGRTGCSTKAWWISWPPTPTTYTSGHRCWPRAATRLPSG